MPRPDRLVAPALGALWTNRAQLRFAWDVLRHAVCNDCSLGASGLSDGILSGSHLCRRRLRRLPRVTAQPFAPTALTDVSTLPTDRRALRAMGRIPCPLLWRAGQAGFAPVGWTDATHLLAARVRDARTHSAWSLLVDPGDVGLETLFQLRRVTRLLERRDRTDLGLPPVMDLLTSPEERALRHGARQHLGTWGSTATVGALQPGDPVAVRSVGDHPLLDDVLDALRARGVLAERTETWSDTVRHTLVYGAPGVFGALACGLTLAPAPPDWEALTAAWIVGEHAGPPPAAAFRAHQAAFLDPSMLPPAAEAVLLLPSELATETAGGASFLADDGTLRYSPKVLGHGVPDAAAGWEIAVRVAAHVDPAAATDLAAHDSAEIRRALAAAYPDLAALADFARPGDVGALSPSPSR